ncbi:hypothetical protein CVU82_00190 [Candidatus Falkowbacteria bacterium HGW-Falkowbacteria-1]|jgi:sRNA-binding protein|uniref:LTD domain-containing protein n=1 Tax=Candidatus Falkowbacteria bacterium HGW-Falkowbacteria-1 TaxID=2013768 RepID=A0A2N2EA79_9BACT|nr:MAG: hypothetical protein CVU82_00190 [Candidatus Falkowbacteria bacterium HGW-Falkowbacteria-1]
MKKILLFFLFLFLLPKTLKADSLPILINQIMIGQNEGAKNEFIELYNPNDYNINLAGYLLKKKTASGSESSLISAKNFIGQISGNGYFLISSKEYCQTVNADLCYSSMASLSKSNTVLLYDNDKKISDKVGYGEATDFSGQVCPEIENNKVLKRKKIDLENPNNYADFTIIENNIEIKNSIGEIIKINTYFLPEKENQKKPATKSSEKIKQMVKINEIKNLKNGDLVKVEGIVANLPGQFGSQYFYILEEENNKNKEQNLIYGMQVYSYNKNFPTLKVGDKISVSGELVNKDYDWKIKTKDINDILFISSGNNIDKQKTIPIKDLSPDQNGNLVQVKGKIAQNKTNAIYLDDGENEILIDIKKGTEIAGKNLKEGNNYIISGTLSGDEKELKIMPLSEKSIQDINNIGEEKIGELINEKYLILEKEEKEKTLIKYFLTTVTMITFYFIFEKKIRNIL